jgi:hypothetical protein
MTKEDYDAFIKAVDVVCINCVCMSEETCEKCPVRKTVNYFSRNKDS